MPSSRCHTDLQSRFCCWPPVRVVPYDPVRCVALLQQAEDRMQVTERRSGNLKGLGALGRRDLRSEQRDRLLAVARAIEGLTRPKLIHPLRESRRAPVGQGRLSMKRTRHTPEQVINKLREAETMLAGSRTVAQLLQHLGVSEATFNRWRNQYGGMKSEQAMMPSHRPSTPCTLRSPLRSQTRQGRRTSATGRFGR